MRSALALAVALIATFVLVACGGGSSNMPTPPADSNEVPASATASPAAFVSYTDSLPASETKDPLDITKAMPPTTESDEPLPI